MADESGTFSLARRPRTGFGRFKESFMARKPHLRSAAAASAAVSPAPSAAPAAPLSPASLAAPTRTPYRALLGPRPLIDGEDETNYDVILERMSADVAPADFVEEIWVRNVVDLVWDSIRLRRLKSQLLHAGAHEGLGRALMPLLGWSRADELSGKWALGDEEAISKVEELLGRAGLTIDDVMAETLAARIDDVERIDRMVIIAEARRDAVLREIRSRRLAFGQALRRAGEAIDAEFEDVAPSPGGA
jgi:hypothetical protein